jgi:hypothetical protein
MADSYPPTKQREALLALARAGLDTRDSALRRDACGDWRINGRFGHIYAVPGVPWGGMEGVEGFQIYFRGAPEFEEPTTSQPWTWAKKALEPFCRVTQDGDMEGMLFLDHLPTPDEAAIIRDKLRIPKKREVSEEELNRLRRQGFHSSGDGSGEKPASDDPEALLCPMIPNRK